MKVWKYLTEKLEKEKLHFTLIDPAEQSEKKARELAKIAEETGTDAIMIGGSYSVKQEKLDETIKEIKKKTKLYVILFPSSARYVSRFADAIFFMSLLNSRKLDYVIGKQVEAALFIKTLGLERIPMGYIVIKPGMRVGKKGKAKLIKRDDVKTAIKYAVAAESLGMKLVYLEAGSGSPKPVMNKMVKGVKEAIDIPLIVGGGIRTSSIAKEKVEAGADIIVTGTSVEKKIKEGTQELEEHLAKIISAIKE